jgi:hypothetical protein
MPNVQLYVYDLSQGMARTLSLALTGKQIDAIYHTSVNVFGVETYYGQGICQDAPGTTQHGQPIQIIEMGETTKTRGQFESFIEEQSILFSYVMQKGLFGGLKTTICLIITVITLQTQSARSLSVKRFQHT